MRRVTTEEFKKLYGDDALTNFSGVEQKQPSGSIFNVQAAKDVFTKAGEDVALAQQGQREADNSLPSTLKTAATMALQGGLSIPRAIGAGVFGTEKAKEVTGNVVEKLTQLGEAITPEVVQQYVGEKASQVIEGYEAMTPQEQLNQRNSLAIAEVLSYFIGGGATKTAVSSAAQASIPAIRQVGDVLINTATKADTVMRSGVARTRDIVAPATDIAKGLGTQVSDFARRTARGAMDTAEQSRRLAKLPEPEARLIRTGIDEPFVNTLKGSTKTEKTIYKELVEQAKKKEADPTPNTPQPKVIAGREFLKPVDYLLTQRNSVGAKLGAIRETLPSTKNINTNNAFRAFDNYLRGRGVVIDKTGKIKQGTGNIAQSDIKEVQKIYSELRSKTFASQKEIDEWLQRTFKEYDLRQAREQTFSDDVTTIAERARKEMRQLMPQNYNALATQYAEVMKPIQDMVKLLGYKGDIAKLTTKELKIAEVALRILGNASDRPQEVINSVLEAATKLGYKSDVDLNKLIYIADKLEDLYDITPSRSLAGSATRGINQSGVGVAADIATGQLGSLFNKALSSSASNKEIREAFETFLNSL